MSYMSFSLNFAILRIETNHFSDVLGMAVSRGPLEFRLSPKIVIGWNNCEGTPQYIWSGV
jgi:hypothetical protein